jgi:hypothetical protein
MISESITIKLRLSLDLAIFTLIAANKFLATKKILRVIFFICIIMMFKPCFLVLYT